MSVVSGVEKTPIYAGTMEKLEKLQKTAKNGTPYWSARNIHPILGYPKWEGFEGVLERAKKACDGVGTSIPDHFHHTTKLVEIGSGGQRQVEDVLLTRTACYLVAMNGDTAKPEIAAAQAYFATQTRRMEIVDQYAHDRKRLDLRERIKVSFKKVSGVAKSAGVRNRMQAIFHDARYLGLYGMPLREVKRRKGLDDQANIMDFAGPMELSANDFQMNLAADVIQRDRVHGESNVIETNRKVGDRVRGVILDANGTPPEQLPIEPPIRDVAKRLRKIEGNGGQADKA